MTVHHYETSDIYLASYLMLKKLKLETIKYEHNKSIFVFALDSEISINTYINSFYSNSDSILEYCNILRNMKSQAVNHKFDKE